MGASPPQLQKYTILEEVGHGGMAIVYRGIDKILNREVAVKVLHAHLAEEEESRQRFHREAHAVAKLRHENIIEIYDYSGLESDESYIVTEFIHGQTLRDFLVRYPISHPEIAAMIIVEVCRALAHAHSLGVIHRDIKPENIMIRSDGVVKLTDFGIAQVVDVARLTVTGQLLGSPAYMAPELVEGKRIDFRSDVFSVGTLLYQLATGELPFRGKNPHELLKRISEGRYLDPEVQNPIVGSKLSRIIRKALAHDPDARYLDINALKNDLAEFIADVDIVDPRRELASYFASPAEYSRRLQDRVVTALCQKGRTALEKRQVPQALEYFNRVLCVDPANKEILGILGRITRRQRLGRALGIAVLLVALAAGAYAFIRNWPSGNQARAASDLGPDRSAARDGSQSPTSDSAPDATVLDQILRRIDLAHDSAAAPDQRRDRGQRTNRPRPKPEPDDLRVVEIIPIPKRVAILQDDKLLGEYGPDLRRITLPARGMVRLTFRNNACCFDRVVTIGPGQRLDTLRVKLPWKPARLKVVVTPPVEADVLVGSLLSQAGQLFEVPIPSYSDDGRTELEVKVSAEGFYTETRRIQLSANAPQILPLTLRRIP